MNMHASLCLCLASTRFSNSSSPSGYNLGKVVSYTHHQDVRSKPPKFTVDVSQQLAHPLPLLWLWLWLAYSPSYVSVHVHLHVQFRAQAVLTRASLPDLAHFPSGIVAVAHLDMAGQVAHSTLGLVLSDSVPSAGLGAVLKLVPELPADHSRLPVPLLSVGLGLPAG